MTTLQLDIPQRVNLVVMLDALECPGRREVFAICRLQEKLQLSDEEREAVGYQKIMQDGREYVLWQQNEICRAPKPFEVADDDMARLCRAVDQFRMVPARDRAWYDPLVKQLPEPSEQQQAQPVAALNGAGAR